MARVGYYDVSNGSGQDYQVNEIEAGGHEAVTITEFTEGTLADLDVLYVLNESNNSWGAEFVAARQVLTDAVNAGLKLIVFDRNVRAIETVLPGVSEAIANRDFDDSAEIDHAPDVPSAFLNGAASPLNDTMFDEGNHSSHGYVLFDDLPENAVPLQTRSDDSRVVTFAYPWGNGSVIYSSIPLDHYSATNRDNITPEEVALLVTASINYLLNGGPTPGQVIDGSDGNDTLTGDSGPDTLKGGTGDDLLEGLEGWDHLIGGPGNDTMIGGPGSDLYFVDSPGDVVTELADQGRDGITANVNVTLPGHVEDLLLIGGLNLNGAGNALGNRIQGNTGDNLLFGDAGSDWLVGATGGDDTLDGGDDNDMASFAMAATGAVIDLAAGTAVVDGATITLQNIENLSGTGFDDLLSGDTGANLIRGLGGNDWITATSGDDTVEGGTGRDMVSYVNSHERIVASFSGDNMVVTRFGPAEFLSEQTLLDIEGITGTGKSDIFIAGSGGWTFRGMNGFDWMIAGTGADVFDGGLARDTVSFVTSNHAVHASLAAGRGWTGDAAGDMFLDIENITGGRGNDTITGDDDRNVLRGMAGNDLLTGKGGADDLFGYEGDDTLDGGAGFDTAEYAGVRADYTVTRMMDGSVQVDGTEGTDTLWSVEGLIFADDFLYL